MWHIMILQDRLGRVEEWEFHGDSRFLRLKKKHDASIQPWKKGTNNITLQGELAPESPKANMTLENFPFSMGEIHLHSWWIFLPVMLANSRGGKCFEVAQVTLVVAPWAFEYSWLPCQNTRILKQGQHPGRHPCNLRLGMFPYAWVSVPVWNIYIYIYTRKHLCEYAIY